MITGLYTFAQIHQTVIVNFITYELLLNKFNFKNVLKKSELEIILISDLRKICLKKEFIVLL